MIDLSPRQLQAKGLAPNEVLNTLNLQNLVLPSGTAKIGEFEYSVTLNASPRTVSELADLPIRVMGNSAIFLKDVANVRDGFGVQTDMVRGRAVIERRRAGRARHRRRAGSRRRTATTAVRIAGAVARRHRRDRARRGDLSRPGGSAGLSTSDAVILDPVDSLTSGTAVRVSEKPAKEPGP
jgi:hypothetical protein